MAWSPMEEYMIKGCSGKSWSPAWSRLTSWVIERTWKPGRVGVGTGGNFEVDIASLEVSRCVELGKPQNKGLVYVGGIDHDHDIIVPLRAALSGTMISWWSIGNSRDSNCSVLGSPVLTTKGYVSEGKTQKNNNTHSLRLGRWIFKLDFWNVSKVHSSQGYESFL